MSPRVSARSINRASPLAAVVLLAAFAVSPAFVLEPRPGPIERVASLTATPEVPPTPPAAAMAVEPSGPPAVPAAFTAATDMPVASPPPPPPSSAPPVPAGPSCDPRSVPAAAAPAAWPVLATRGFSLHVPVLMYHRVLPMANRGKSLPGLVVPPEVFAAQMQALAAAGWRTTTLAALAEDLDAGRRPEPRTLVITFDDGREDGYTYAYPILRGHGFVATYFVITGHIGHPTDLTPGELRDLVAAGNEIADHSVDHVDLRTSSPARLRYEIDAAAQAIATWTGEWPRTLAYPFGKYDADVVAAVASCAPIRMAVTTVPGAAESAANRYAVPRIRVTPWTTPGALVANLRRYA